MGHGIAVRPTLPRAVPIMGTDVLLVCVQEFLRGADYKLVYCVPLCRHDRGGLVRAGAPSPATPTPPPLRELLALIISESRGAQVRRQFDD